MRAIPIVRIAPACLFLAVALLCTSFEPHSSAPDWGFFAHRRINRLAVLTLPPEMMVFFKKHIDWISDHAVDPDMRRYATKHEAPRHYIDLDNYGAPPYDSLPRLWLEAMIRYTDLYAVPAPGDTVLVFGKNRLTSDSLRRAYKRYFTNQVLPRFYRDETALDADSLETFLLDNGLDWPGGNIFYREKLSEHGILPWNLQRMQRGLTDAFRRRDARAILRHCADMGHYIGDAHVPLHTTSNYNGQKTNQHGIHGFWESRIPELFADDSYDYFVGKPEYFENASDFYWNTVLASNSMVDSVLNIERFLKNTFPSDRQMCPDLRLGISVLAQCREYAQAYQIAMNGMVERRLRAAIHAVGSAWYTAWVDAGQPNLSKMDQPLPAQIESKEEAELKKSFGDGKILGRPEEH